jgi:hypothetical protein
MAAPSFVQAGTGATDAGGTFSISGAVGTENNFLICHVLQDGATSGAVGATFGGGSKNLAGTTSAMTYVGEFAVGSATAAYQHIWVGRCTGGAPQIFGTNSTSEDVYGRWYEFQDVNTGTAITDVIENGTAGTTVNGPGTSDTAGDVAVVTLGADRLPLQLLAVNDDNITINTSTPDSIWTKVGGGYADAGGTDGSISLYRLTGSAATAGTYGGSESMSVTDSDAWGVVGFALIGTTVASTPGPTNPNRRRSALALHRRRM